MIKTVTLIPHPRSIRETGASFRLSDEVGIVCSTGARPAAELLRDIIAADIGLRLAVNPELKPETYIQLTGGDDHRTDEAGFRDEAYSLRIDSTCVALDGATPEALACAVQTLRQLLPEKADGVLPGLEISDAPHYRWRGMLLDVARHFFTVEEVCRLIELMALYKYNVLHWHLTDDQGWRIEIENYPRLTAVGSKRNSSQSNHMSDRPIRYDGKEHAGFYTKAEVRHIIDFAARRGIRILPEIDMPGHVQALLAAYPEFGNLPGCHYQVRESWGIGSHILNIAPATFAAMRDILDEVVDLFPWTWVHIGGDEVKKEEWSASRAVQERMLELSLRDEHELQSYFVAQMAAHLKSRGRRAIGWDEIIEGGLPPDAAVMCWHGESGGIHAAELGHYAVMSDSAKVYLNHYQADPATEPLSHGYELPLALVYRFDPAPDGLAEQVRKFILGGQGALWTEYIATMKHLEYMAFPRACALAERLWLPPGKCDYHDFLMRLRRHRALMARHRIAAHPLPL